MLGFDAMATIPLAGSPLSSGAAVGYIWSLDAGVYTLAADPLVMTKTNVMPLDGGVYTLVGDGTFIARHRTYDFDGGVYTLLGGEARLFTSSFFYGDPEVFRVTPEVTFMRVLPEPLDMAAAAKPLEAIAVDDNDNTLEPRLRRT